MCFADCFVTCTATAPTGLMALQGEDHHGKLIRKELKKVGVETRFIEGSLFHPTFNYVNIRLN